MMRIILGVLINQCMLAQQVYSVCGALENIATLKDAVVIVRGQWVTGLEQSFVRDESCVKEFTFSNRRWPAAINLAMPQSVEERMSVNKVENFFSDRLGLSWKISRDVSRMQKIVVTVKGRLRLTPEILLNSGNVRQEILGYGHGNTFAAQLEVLSMDEPQIVKLDDKRKVSP